MMSKACLHFALMMHKDDPNAYFLRFNTQGKISRLDAYWDNTVLNSIKPSAV